MSVTDWVLTSALVWGMAGAAMAYFAEFFEFGGINICQKTQWSKKMTPLIGAGISIFLICLLLVLRVPMLVAVMAGVFSEYISPMLGRSVCLKQ